MDPASASGNLSPHTSNLLVLSPWRRLDDDIFVEWKQIVQSGVGRTISTLHVEHMISVQEFECNYPFHVVY